VKSQYLNGNISGWLAIESESGSGNVASLSMRPAWRQSANGVAYQRPQWRGPRLSAGVVIGVA